MSYFQKFAINCLTVVLATILPAARAAENDHRTVIDVPYPVQVESTILQPGRYVIRLVDPGHLTVVRILSADEKTVFATIQGSPVYRSTILTEKTEFWFSPTPKGRPRVVRAWFYPGDEMGLEVISSRPAKHSAEHSAY